MGAGCAKPEDHLSPVPVPYDRPFGCASGASIDDEQTALTRPPPLPNETERAARAEELKEAAKNLNLDRTVGLVKRACGGDMSMVNIMGTDSLACIAVDAPPPIRAALMSTSVPKEESVCEVLINTADSDVLYVPDCHEDPRFSSLPGVKNGLCASYAGHVLKSTDGQRLGTLCSISSTVRPAHPMKAFMENLEDFAAVTMERLEAALEKSAKDLHEARQHQRHLKSLNAELAGSTPLAHIDLREHRDVEESQDLGELEIEFPYLGVTPIDNIPHMTPPKYVEFEGEWMSEQPGEDEILPEWWKNWDEGFPRPPLPTKDHERAQQLPLYHIVGAECEDVFERLVEGAQQLSGVSIAVISWAAEEVQHVHCLITDNPLLAPMKQIKERPRNYVVCNYTMKKKAPVVIPDMKKHPLVKDNPEVAILGLSFYAGVPILNKDGWPLGTLCLLDIVPHYDFTGSMVLRMQSMCELVVRQLELRRIQKENEILTLQHKCLYDKFVHNKQAPPANTLSFLVASVEGAATLWGDCAITMAIAQDMLAEVVHAAAAEYFGYVVTDGRQFEVAFHTPNDSLSCSLAIQRRLLTQNWPADVVAHPLSCTIVSKYGERLYHGLRVRMGIVTAETSSYSTAEGRFKYMGAAVTRSQAIHDCAKGGQILCCAETWLNATIGDAQTIDLGEHVYRCGFSVRTFEVLPSELGCFGLPTSSESSTSFLKDTAFLLSSDSPTPSPAAVGAQQQQQQQQLQQPQQRRRFSRVESMAEEWRAFYGPLDTLVQLSPSFWDAPRDEIALVFLFIADIKALRLANPTLAMAVTNVICNVVRQSLREHQGYECQEILGSFMVSFKSAAKAVRWCCHVHQTLKMVTWPPELTTHRIKKLSEVVVGNPRDHVKTGMGVSCGVQKGTVVDFRPHDKTGRMDYFGPIVNKTARLASSAHEGQTVVGEEAFMSAEFHESSNLAQYIVQDYGLHQLKGVDRPQHLYGVSPSSKFFLSSEENAVTAATDFPLPNNIGTAEPGGMQ